MARVQVLAISKHRLLSARRPPSPIAHSPRVTSTGDNKISFLGAIKEKLMFDCYFKPASPIDARKLVEEEKVDIIMLHKCKTIKQLKQVHLQILRSNDAYNTYNLLVDKLMLLSSDLISFDYAYRVFMDLPSNPSLSSYNNLIRCSIGKSDNIAASAYNRMRNNEDNIILPDRFTLAFLLKSFASFSRLEGGQTVHGHVIKLGFVSDTFVMNSLLDFYFKFVQGHLGLGVVRQVFEEIPERDIVSWNTLISGLVYKRLSYEALLAFDDMLLSADHRCKPDETTLTSMVTACTHKKLFEQGKWLDSYIKENKFVLSVPLGNALITMFVCFDDLGNAKMVFKSMPKRSTLTWEMMMSGLVVRGFCKETLALFDTMCCEGGLKPNDDIFSSVLIAFSKEEMLVGDGERLFRVIHQMVHGFGVKPNRTHYNFMIRILSDAGWVEAAMMLAESLPWKPDTTDWAHVLRACQVHGSNLLLDSWIRKISDEKSKRYFMKCTIKLYTWLVFSRKPNNDVNYAKLMVESLIRKLPDRECVEELNKDLEYVVRINSTPEEGQDNLSSVHARETLPPHDEDDVYKAAESLDKQLLDDLRDVEMINIIDDHNCQLGI